MKGQITLEILISLFILVVSISAAFTVSFGTQSMTIDTQLNNQALYIARQGLESARAASRQDFNSLVSTSSAEDIYLKETSVQNIDTYTKKVTSRVSWQTEPLRPQKIELATLLTDKQTALDEGGDGGGSSPTGNWQSLITLGTIDVGPGNQATDVDVFGNTVYISTQASVKSTPDIHAFNVSNPVSPSLLDNLDVGAYALASIDYNSDYVYGASTGVIPDLKVIDAHNPGNLSVASEFNVITFVNAKSVLKVNTTVYLGVQKTSFNGEFFTIDVTDPLNPSQIDVFEINGDVNKIFYKNHLAYIATSRDDRELFILNVANPADIKEAGYLNIGGSADANSVFVQSASRVFLGAGNIFYVLDATDPLHVSIIGSLDVGGIINDIYVAGALAFLATSNSNREFQIIDVSNSASPALYSYLNLAQIATGIDYQNNIVYVSIRSNDGLRIITSSP
ncbi:MAG: hypothetical protein Q8N42_00800 [bacterium]|nr:hypothetical protein [bacterium]